MGVRRVWPAAIPSAGDLLRQNAACCVSTPPAHPHALFVRSGVAGEVEALPTTLWLCSSRAASPGTRMLRFDPSRASSRTLCALRCRGRGRSLAYDTLAVQLESGFARNSHAAFRGAACFLTHLMCAPVSQASPKPCLRRPGCAAESLRQDAACCVSDPLAHPQATDHHELRYFRLN